MAICQQSITLGPSASKLTNSPSLWRPDLTHRSLEAMTDPTWRLVDNSACRKNGDVLFSSGTRGAGALANRARFPVPTRPAVRSHFLAQAGCRTDPPELRS